MSYISLFNKSQFTGDINADYIKFNGEVDFTDASPIIGLTDNITLETINNPTTALVNNLIQIKNAGVTDIKIVSMDANKLTGHISISGTPNKIYFNIDLDTLQNNIVNIGNIIPVDGASNLGDIIHKFLALYCETGNFDIKINTPIVDNSLGVSLQYNGSEVLKTTLSGITITGNILQTGSIAISGNIYPLIDQGFTLGLSINRWQTVYTKSIDSSDGLLLKYNNDSRIIIHDLDVTIYRNILPSLDGSLNIGNSSTKFLTAYLSNIDGNPVTIKNNGTDTLTTTTLGINVTGEIQVINGDVYPTNSSLYNLGRSTKLWNNCYVRYIDYPSGPILRYNSSDRLTVTSSGIQMNGIVDLNNNNVTNANTITSAAATNLTLTSTSALYLNYDTSITSALYLGGNQQKNKKFVLYDLNPSSEHTFDGFGVNNGVFRFQLCQGFDSFVFYVASSGSTSVELFRINGTAITASRNLSMSSNNITNVAAITATTVNTGTINNSTGVNIQYNGSTKLATSNTGISVTGNLDMQTGNINNVTTLNATNAIMTGTTKTAGMVYGHRSVSGNTTLTETDYILSVDTTSASIVLTLPLISGLTYSTGRVWIIKDIAGYANKYPITVNTTSPNLLDGKATWYLTVPYGAVQMYCNGTNYFIL